VWRRARLTVAATQVMFLNVEAENIYEAAEAHNVESVPTVRACARQHAPVAFTAG
jgi:hypothetical protein